MKVLLAVVFLSGVWIVDSVAQQKGREDLRALREAGKPNQVHDYLGRMVGNWKVRGFARISPDKNPEMISGAAKFEWILGRRFLQQEFNSRNLDLPFQGLGLLGYDVIRNEVTAVWCDTSNTGIANLTGKVEDGGRRISLNLSQTSLENGERIKARAEIVFEGASAFRYSVFVGDQEMLQLNYSK